MWQKTFKNIKAYTKILKTLVGSDGRTEWIIEVAALFKSKCHFEKKGNKCRKAFIYNNNFEK